MYAELSPQTVKAWEKSYSHLSSVVSHRNPRDGLSFLQLIEVAVVARLRKKGVKLDEIRRARDYFSKRLESPYPFAKEAFKTDGVDILIDFRKSDGGVYTDRMIAANREGQMIWSEVISERLDEFNYERNGYAIQWFLRGREHAILVDPRLSYGSPSVKGVMTRVLKSRWKLGETVSEIADDFDISKKLVLRALEFEGISTPGSIVH